jgi:uncharacterized membrane-anchored protein YitT (DUF2179 family)
MHYCLHIIKSPDTYSFCCVSNHYMYYYYYYYFILPWNCPSLISKLIIIIILFSHGIVRHLSQSSLLSLFYSPMELSVTYLKAHYYHYFILPWNCPSLISKLKLYEASHECYPLCLGVQLCIKFAKLPWQWIRFKNTKTILAW